MNPDTIQQIGIRREVQSSLQAHPELVGDPPCTRGEAEVEMPVPHPWTEEDPPLQVGEEGSFFGLDTIHPKDLIHAGVFGATGSGKTCSVIIPMLKAVLRYTLRNGKYPSLLLVDPKRELLAVAQDMLKKLGQPHRLHRVGCDANPPVGFFDGDSRETMRDRWAKIEVLLPFRLDSGEHAYWHENAMTVIRKLLELQQRAAGSDPHARLLTEWARQCGIDLDSTHSLMALEALLPHLITYGQAGLDKPLELLKSLCAGYGIPEQDAGVLDMYLGSPSAFDQLLYVVTCARPVLATLADRGLSRLVDLDPVPDPRSPRTNIMALLDSGRVIALQPWEKKATVEIAVRAIKGKFHASVFARRDQERPVFTVVDEYHRFMTRDPDGDAGDQVYLDRCRGFRATMIYATQAIHSLHDALGANDAARSATKVVLCNTPTKFFMRTTDDQEGEMLKRLLPGPPQAGSGYPHVVDVHRPASLETGQAYVLWGNGKWALRRAR